MGLTLTRTLQLSNPMMYGGDVLAVQKLLTSKGFPVEPDGIFGSQTGAACVEAKVRLQYPKEKQIPTCGQFLVDALEAHAPFKPLPLPPARTRYVAQLRTFLKQKALWDYSQSRPIPHKGHVGRVVTDCSGGVTYGAELAGCPDPNGKIGGEEFSGYGFTGTLMSNCQHIARSQLLPGDLVVFGSYPGHHVAAVLEAGSDPVLWSHGRQGDPRTVSLSAEASAQAASGHAPVTYLRFL